MGFFNAAVGEWFGAQVGGTLDDYLLRADASCLQLFDETELRRLVTTYKAERNGRLAATMMLRVLMLEVWLSTYLPRALRPAAV